MPRSSAVPHALFHKLLLPRRSNEAVLSSEVLRHVDFGSVRQSDGSKSCLPIVEVSSCLQYFFILGEAPCPVIFSHLMRGLRSHLVRSELHRVGGIVSGEGVLARQSVTVELLDTCKSGGLVYLHVLDTQLWHKWIVTLFHG